MIETGEILTLSLLQEAEAAAEVSASLCPGNAGSDANTGRI